MLNNQTMEDFRLRVFLTVARLKSFSKAARQLYISQPAISRHIRELEEKIGFPLFWRQGNSISLTQQGAIFLQQARKVEIAYQELSMLSSELSNHPGGEMRLGASTTISQYLLPDLLAQYLNQHPTIQCSLISGNTHQIEQQLLADKIDLGLVEGAHQTKGLHYIPFCQDELLVVAHPSQLEHLPKTIDAKNLQDFPLILREHGSGTLEIFTHWLKKRNLQLGQMHILMHLGSSESIKRFLRHQPALAIISRYAVADEITRQALVTLPLQDDRITRQFYLTQPDGPVNPLIKNFMRFLLHQN